MMPTHFTNAISDIVSLSALQLAAIIGPDHWHRTRPQPIQLSLYLHLTPLYLDAPGQSDDIADSLHYGHLTKAAERRVNARAGEGYASARDLVDDVTDAAFTFVSDALKRDSHAVGEVLRAVRVVLSLPKQILLAGGFEVDLATSASDWAARLEPVGLRQVSRAGMIVRVTDLVLPVLIGVNPPERLAKQRVITDLTFFEASSSSAEKQEVDYPAIVQQITNGIERSTYLTLEKLVYEIIQTAYRASDVHPSSQTSTSQIECVTVRCRKPSALSFADASGVEMTRMRKCSSQ